MLGMQSGAVGIAGLSNKNPTLFGRRSLNGGWGLDEMLYNCCGHLQTLPSKQEHRESYSIRQIVSIMYNLSIHIYIYVTIEINGKVASRTYVFYGRFGSSIMNGNGAAFYYTGGQINKELYYRRSNVKRHKALFAVDKC